MSGRLGPPKGRLASRSSRSERARNTNPAPSARGVLLQNKPARTMRAQALAALLALLAAPIALAAEGFQRPTNGDCIALTTGSDASLFPEQYMMVGDERSKDGFVTQASAGGCLPPAPSRRRPLVPDRCLDASAALASAAASCIPAAVCCSEASLTDCTTNCPSPRLRCRCHAAAFWPPELLTCSVHSSIHLQVNSSRGFSVEYFPTYKASWRWQHAAAPATPPCRACCRMWQHLLTALACPLPRSSLPKPS